ncbi:MAG: S-layer homology domain-containing protein, partial [Anaerovoracaceae bacterium]
MKAKKVFTIVLSALLVLTLMPAGAFALDKQGGEIFSDMPNNWSTSALEKAVANGLLKGYAEGDKLLIKATAPIKRAEMAAVVNRAFGAVKKAGLGGVTDVAATSWYADDIAKAVMMGTFMKDNKMRPEDGITRQEAFTVLARAFKITSEGTGGLNSFTDKGQVAAWAENSLSAMVTAGYVQGSGGKINPKANISRAEFAVVMDNLVKQYIVSPGEVTEVVTKGNVLVRSSDVTLRNVTINGDLIIADGVGEGDVTLDGVTVTGRTVVRGGGENSILIKGNSSLGKVIVAKVDGKVRVAVEGGANVEIIYVDDGSDDVIVEGRFGELEVAGDDVTANAQKANIDKVEVSGDNSRIVIANGSKVKDGNITGNSSAIVADEGSSIGKVTISGSDASVSGKGEVKEVEVKKGGDGANVTTPNTKTVVDKDVDGVTSGNQEVQGGQTATNNATGDGATVTQPSTGGSGSGSNTKVSVS